MKTVLIECQHLYYLPQIEPIINEMLRRGNYDINISMPITAGEWERRYLSEASSTLGISLLDADTEKERIHLLHQKAFDVIIVGNVGVIEKIAADKSLVVMVYHGIGLKKSYYRDISTRINLRAVESELRYKELKLAGASNLVLTGFTKLDPLFQKYQTIKKEEIFEKAQLNPEKKTILYAPTFYPTSLRKLMPEMILTGDEMNIILKLHHFSWHHNRYRYQKRYVEKLLNEHICLLPPYEYNILPYFLISDVLITDISSTMFEFLALNRPIIQTLFYDIKIRHRLFPWRFSRKLDKIRVREVDFVHKLESPKEYHHLVKYVLENPGEMAMERKKAANRFLYRLDGKASLRLVDAIESKILKQS